jgi:hypothetical protein
LRLRHPTEDTENYASFFRKRNGETSLKGLTLKSFKELDIFSEKLKLVFIDKNGRSISKWMSCGGAKKLVSSRIKGREISLRKVHS